MNKKRFLFVVCFMLALSCSGCFEEREPENVAVGNSVLYDLTGDGLYKCIVEVMKPAPSESAGAQTEGEGQKTVLFTGYGKSVRDAIDQHTLTQQGGLFGAQIRARFLSEAMARSDLVPLLDFLTRAYLTIETPLFMVIKAEEPEKVYACRFGLSDMAGNYIFNLSTTQPNFTAKSVFVTTLDFIKDYYSEGKQPVAGVVSVVEDETANAQKAAKAGSMQQGEQKQYKLVCEGLAAFKDSSLVGFLSGDETSAYNYVTGNMKASFVTLKSEGETAVLMITRMKPAVKINDGEQISLDLSLKASIRLISISGERDVRFDSEVRAIEAQLNEYLKNQITQTIARVQSEFKSDIFGFGEHMHMQHPKKWEQIKSEWDEHFSAAAVNVSVESSIVRTGQIKQPFEKGG